MVKFSIVEVNIVFSSLFFRFANVTRAFGNKIKIIICFIIKLKKKKIVVFSWVILLLGADKQSYSWQAGYRLWLFNCRNGPLLDATQKYSRVTAVTQTQDRLICSSPRSSHMYQRLQQRKPDMVCFFTNTLDTEVVPLVCLFLQSGLCMTAKADAESPK